jgi:hypothetical protein
MKTLFILGAGASREAGGPLMKDFLDEADELRRAGASGVADARESFDNVFRAISDLQGIYAKSHLDLDNIETVFGAIEMGVLLGKLGERKDDEILRLRDDIITVIYKTLETSIRFPVKERGIYPPQPYGDFVEMLVKTNRSSPPPFTWSDLTFLTFNYDLALDFALHHRGIKFHYALPGDPNVGIPYLKLHGSINWGICSKCHQIVPYQIGAPHFELWHDPKYVVFNLGSQLGQVRHCDVKLTGPPVLVPPTWNKTVYHGQIGTVWKRACQELASAENVLVVGYSLPESDLFFRYLYAIGSESKTTIKRFWVFDPDQNNEVEARFRRLIGRGIEGRFRFFREPFGKAMNHIRDAVGAA